MLCHLQVRSHSFAPCHVKVRSRLILCHLFVRRKHVKEDGEPDGLEWVLISWPVFIFVCSFRKHVKVLFIDWFIHCLLILLLFFVCFSFLFFLTCVDLTFLWMPYVDLCVCLICSLCGCFTCCRPSKCWAVRRGRKRRPTWCLWLATECWSTWPDATKWRKTWWGFSGRTEMYGSC